jgi:hypothetical protein
MPTRRQLLAASGLAVASAGCTDVFGDDGSDSGTAEASTDPEMVRLETLAVQNNHEEAHQVQLAVEADGEVLLLGNYDLDPAGGSTTVEGDWSSEAGSYRIHARLDDGGIRSTDVTEGVPAGATCVRVLVRVDGDGHLAIWNGADCEA